MRRRRLTSPQCRWPPLLPRLCSSAPWASEAVGGGAGAAHAEGAGIDGGPGSGLPRCQVRGAREAACGEGRAVVRWAAPSRARPSGEVGGVAAVARGWGRGVGGCGRGLAGPDSRAPGVPGTRGAGGASRAGPKPPGWPGCPDAGRLVQ